MFVGADKQKLVVEITKKNNNTYYYNISLAHIL